MIDVLRDISELISWGGLVLWLIFLVSLLLWALILGLYLDVYRHKSQTIATLDVQPLLQRLSTVENLVYVLPLLGLLGTVSGMIEAFEVLMTFGASNPRGLSGGISRALLTTLAGLLISLPGLYFHHDLLSRVKALGESANSEKIDLRLFSPLPLLGLRKLVSGDRN